MNLFWDDPIPTGSRQTIRIAPPIPETDWVMPTEFPDLRGQGMIAIDTETYDPDLRTKGPGSKRGGYIAGVSIGTEAGYRQYFPVAHQGYTNCDKAQVYAWLNDQLSDPAIPKVGARLIYDMEMMENEGLSVKGPLYDVQNAEPLLDENQISYSLENIGQRRIGEGKRNEVMSRWLEAAYGGTNIKANIYRAPPQVVGPYAESDVDLPLRIFDHQQQSLHREGLWNLFQLESKLIPMLLKMRQRGVRVDTDKAEQLKIELVRQEAEAMAKIKHLTGIEPDIWANDSLAKLFDAEGINYERTPKGAPSFRKEWLEKHPWEGARALVAARHAAKFKGTFVEGYILEGNVNGRIYAQFNQLRGEQGGAVSGRFSSSQPNLQNLPIRDPVLGPLIRSIFLPEDQCQWWKIDWSQIEFRLAVHFAYLLRLRGSHEVVNRYLNDYTTDYHQVTADLTGLPRSFAKSVNFGIVYGLGLPALCDQLNIGMDEGANILRQYHRDLPFVKPLYNTAMNRARDTGEIKTLGGRRRRFNIWEKGNSYFRESEMLEYEQMTFEDGNMLLQPGWKRAFIHKALNALLQGSAADIMKTAMVMILESGALDYLGAPHLTVHDELDGSLDPSPAAMQALEEVRHIMETCVTLSVPLLADLTIAENWGKTKN